MAPRWLIHRMVLWSIIPAAIIVISTATAGFFSSPYFAVRQVVLRGDDAAVLQEVANTVNLPDDMNTLLCDMAALESRVEKCPRVLTAVADRDLPSKIVITVRERKPAFALKAKHGFVLVDRYGVLFMHGGQQVPGYPRVYDESDVERTLGGRLNEDCLRTVLSCMLGAKRAGMNMAFSVDVTQPYNYRLRTADGTVIKLGGPRNIVRKLMFAQSIRKDAREKGKRAVEIDVRLPTMPTPVKYAPATSYAQ